MGLENYLPGLALNLILLRIIFGDEGLTNYYPQTEILLRSG
jgi:hypothetical protein